MKRFLLKDQGRDERLVEAKDYSYLYFNYYLLRRVHDDPRASLDDELYFVKIVKNNLYEFIDYRTHTISDMTEFTLKQMVLDITRLMAEIINDWQARYHKLDIDSNELGSPRHIKKRDLYNYMDHEFINIDDALIELDKDRTNTKIYFKTVVDDVELTKIMCEDKYVYYVDIALFRKLPDITPTLDMNELIKEIPFDPRRHGKGKVLFDVYSTDDYAIKGIYDTLTQHMNDATFIFMTIYRMDIDNVIFKELIKAGDRGANVIVYVELSARGNEYKNAEIIKKLQMHHVKVFYHRDAYKIHAKVMICENSKTKSCYTHISTGNYTTSTGNIYSDLHYVSTSGLLFKKVKYMMNIIMNNGYDLQKTYCAEDDILFFSPVDIREAFVRQIKYVIKVRKENKLPGKIWIKCNHLYDGEIVELLEEATQLGIDIRVICRTTYQYTANPYMNKLNIRRIVGQMLEHDRVYIFGINGVDIAFTGSADILSRKLSKRVEILTQLPKELDMSPYFLSKWQISMPFYLDNY